MPSCVAFLPWLALQSPVTVYDVRLIPYRRGLAPGDTTTATQADVDGVLAAYAIRKDHPVERAALVEVGDWHTGQDADDETRERLFRVRELLTFTGLAGREFFRGRGYCSFDNFALYLQRFVPGDTQHFTFNTRRRDGGASITWGATDFAFLKPLHVDENARPNIDERFLFALLQADAAIQAPFSAIVEFNRANSDSQDVPVHTEVVMTKSAFEYFLDVGHKSDEMVAAFLRIVPPRLGNRPLQGPLANRWPMVRGGVPIRAIETWAREFCVRRNESAHGARRGANQNLVWSEHAHLAFAAILLPLLVKQRLAAGGFYQMREVEQIQLELIESYLMFDPFAPVASPYEHPEHPWSTVYSEEVVREKLRRGLEREMAKIDWANIPPQ